MGVYIYTFGLKFVKDIFTASVIFILGTQKVTHWLVGWLVGWLVRWLVDWLVGWLVG